MIKYLQNLNQEGHKKMEHNLQSVSICSDLTFKRSSKDTDAGTDVDVQKQ